MDTTSQPVIEKLTDVETVASIPFKGVHLVAKYIWLLQDWILLNGLHPAGTPSCTIGIGYHDEPEHYVGIPCEAQWRISGPPIPGKDGVVIKTLPPQRVLSTYHLGDTNLTFTSFQAIMKVVTAKGYRINGPLREIYLFDLSAPKSKWITECQIPVEHIMG